MKIRIVFCSLIPFLVAAPYAQCADTPHVIVGEFPQEVPVFFTEENGDAPGNNVHSIHLNTKGGIVARIADDWVYFNPEAAPAPKLIDGETMFGYVEKSKYAKAPGEIRQAVAGRTAVTVASTDGLFEDLGLGFRPVIVEDGLGRRWGTSDVRGVTVDTEGYRWFVSLAGVARETADGWTFYSGAEGLPYNDFTCAEAGPDGSIWFGTKKGAIRFKDGEWAYRQGLGWLPHDEVRDIAIEENGTAWFATPGGVGVIERRNMTLAEKADHYENDMDLIRRTPFGYTAEISLATPGDKTSEVRHHDSDNDGLWTAMYGAGECFAYAATKDPKAKERAKAAFEALRFLQKVTQGGEHIPPHGYVARTIRSVDLPDPNIGRMERDRVNRDERESLWKVYEPRWPKSADGKWFWKSDTSSDELDGHYFFYPIYYDLVAETEEEKERVREVVRDLTDHLLEHDYNLIDHDGKVTRWGVYNPDEMNHDGYWWYERGLKSLSMLSYLAVAEHMTGDKKYQDHFDSLVKDHSFDTNAIHYKIHSGFGSGNQSDDEMAFMSYYNLVNYVKDEDVKKKIMMSFYMAWTNEQPEMNPFFNFCYAAFAQKAVFSDPWGDHDIAPWEGWLEDSMETLKGFPLDRYNWATQNSHRLDIVPMSRQNAIDVTDSIATSRARGYRTNGKVIPVENRHFNHWNTDPWRLDYGGAGNGFGNGTVFLLPYYMGLYHGFIEK